MIAVLCSWVLCFLLSFNPADLLMKWRCQQLKSISVTQSLCAVQEQDLALQSQTSGLRHYIMSYLPALFKYVDEHQDEYVKVDLI